MKKITTQTRRIEKPTSGMMHQHACETCINNSPDADWASVLSGLLVLMGLLAWARSRAGNGTTCRSGLRCFCGIEHKQTQQEVKTDENTI